MVQKKTEETKKSATAKPQPKEQVVYVVADKVSITTLAGIKAEGEIIDEKFFVHGEKTLHELIEKGLVIEK